MPTSSREDFVNGLLTVVFGVLLYFSARDFSSLLRRYLVATHEAKLADSTKSGFLANVSHELRTPLNAIIGFSEAMGIGIGGRLNAKHQEYVEDIRESGEHLLNLIEDLIDFSRVDLGHFEIDDERVVALDALDECVHLVQQRADIKGIAIKVSAPAAPITLLCDRRRLKQVVINLLTNAIKFSDPGATVQLGLSLGANEKAPLVTISDDGVGMSPEDIEVALTPFGRVNAALDRNPLGTGLGLPLCQLIMEAHGGALEVVSENRSTRGQK